jgi:hypothetical protein
MADTFPASSSGPVLAPPPPPPRATVEPIAEATYVVRMTVTGAFKRDLEAVRAELSHQFPDGRLEDVLHHCIQVTLTQRAKERRGAGRPARTPSGKNNAYVPKHVRHEVWERDGGACAYVAPDGRRCGSTWQVEYHHVLPAGRGGPPTVENTSLRCRSHNVHHAEQDDGAEHVARAIARRQAELF